MDTSHRSPVDLYALSMQGGITGESPSVVPTWAPPVAMALWMLMLVASTTEAIGRRDGDARACRGHLPAH